MDPHVMALPSMRFNLPDDFFSRYWQREPLVIRAALPAYRVSLSPDELAGLACMEEVESRIVLERDGRSPWEVRYGPFDDTTFAALPDSHWTLLVQAADHWDADLAALKNLFPTIPNWRFDDVMVSYASDQGSAGPHVDQYDVFLLQGLGCRRWQLGGRPADDAPLKQHTDLSLLAGFEVLAEYLLEPGDALYLPPGVAHWGIADGECVTVSIGFRAPALEEVIDAYAASVAASVPGSRRYRDPDGEPLPLRHSGEISAAVLERLLAEVRAELTPASFAGWFGAFVTSPKYPGERPGHDEHLAWQTVRSGAVLSPCRECRFAFIDNDDTLVLFADGKRFPCPSSAMGLIEALCDGRRLAAAEVAGNESIVVELLRCGCLTVDE